MMVAAVGKFVPRMRDTHAAEAEDDGDRTFDRCAVRRRYNVKVDILTRLLSLSVSCCREQRQHRSQERNSPDVHDMAPTVIGRRGTRASGCVRLYRNNCGWKAERNSGRSFTNLSGARVRIRQHL